MSSLENLINTAKSVIGTKYSWGGSDTENGFDCSGFVQWVYKHSGITLPRTTYKQYEVGQRVTSITDLSQGDLIFFNTDGSGASHVGIYLGDNKFIHAPTTGDFVKISTLSDYYIKRFVGGVSYSSLTSDSYDNQGIKTVNNATIKTDGVTITSKIFQFVAIFLLVILAVFLIIVSFKN